MSPLQTERSSLERELRLLDPAARPMEHEAKLSGAGGEPPPRTSPEPAPSAAPFAPEPPAGSYWPLRTEHSRVVSFRTKAGKYEGTKGRSFGHERSRGRLHAAIDLFASLGDPVIACQDGEVLAFYCFLPSNRAIALAQAGDRSLQDAECRDGRATYALLVRHGGIVANYGEVDRSATRALGLHVPGAQVRAGQMIGRVGKNPGGSSMLHFETFRASPEMLAKPRNIRWKAGTAPHPDILDPTQYLRFLQRHGRIAPPAGATASTAPSSGDGTSFGSVLEIPTLLARGLWSMAAHAAMLAGQLDESRLTDLIFHARHPERRGASIRRDERELAREWVEIRDRIIRPLLRSGTSPTPSVAAPAPAAPRAPAPAPAPSPAAPRPSAAPAGGAAANDRAFRYQPKRGGYVRYGGGRVDEVLPRLRATGALSITDDDIALLQRIANVESSGQVQAINSGDDSYMSMGFMQWTVKHTDRYFPDGKLQRLIRMAEPAFARHGIVLEATRRWRLTSGETVYTPLAIVGATKAGDLRSLAWAKRFWAAGLDPEVVVPEARLALTVLQEGLQRIMARKGIGPGLRRFYDASLQVRALIQETYNHRPAWLYLALQRAMARATAEGTTRADRFLAILNAEIKTVYAAHGKAKSAKNLATKTPSARP